METILLDDPFPLKGSGLPRSTDHPHLTSLIVEYLRAIGQKTFDKDPDDSQKLGMEMGFVWEDVFSRALGARMVGGRPPELVKDGIGFSPDCVVPEEETGWDTDWAEFIMESVLGDRTYMGVTPLLDLIGPITRVEDYKLTKMGIPLEGEEGSPTPITIPAIEKFQSNRYQMMQAMGYCYALECDTFIHHVVYVNGNYRDHRGWFYQKYQTVFTAEELVENWKLLKAQGRSMGVL